jgi:hypothetical protein
MDPADRECWVRHGAGGLDTEFLDLLSAGWCGGGERHRAKPA